MNLSKTKRISVGKKDKHLLLQDGEKLFSVIDIKYQYEH